MILEFKLYKLKEKSETYKKFLKNNNIPDGLIIVGEKLLSKDYDCYQALQFGEEGDLVLIAGTKINQCGLLIKKDDLELTLDCGYESVELDIPKNYLTMDIIEDIQRLNS